jgi:DNA-binding MarR family transcriptional regulator
MSLDQKARILEATVSTSCGVRDLVQALEWKTSTVISLLREMNKEKLIDLQRITYSRRGRPKKNIVCTPLGFEFLETYRKLKMKPLRARKEDLEHAVRDASYTIRLVANGHSPFQIFMELNTIASNIKVSSETSETI